MARSFPCRGEVLLAQGFNLSPFHQPCKFDPKAIDHALSDQIENLDDLVGQDERAAEVFFGKTYVTGRHEDPAAAGPAAARRHVRTGGLRIKQAMRSGKPHSMLALGYLAVNWCGVLCTPERGEDLAPVHNSLVPTTSLPKLT